MKPLKSSICHLLAICLLAAVGCTTHRPSSGGWRGPLVDPDGQRINPPTYEVAP
jgi:hypothetical protein